RVHHIRPSSDSPAATSPCAKRRRTLAFTRTRTDCISFSWILPAFRPTSCTIHSGLNQSFPHSIQRRFVGLGLTLGVFGRLFLGQFLFCRFFKRHFFFRRRTLLYRFMLFLFGLLLSIQRCRNLLRRVFWCRLGNRWRQQFCTQIVAADFFASH